MRLQGNRHAGTIRLRVLLFLSFLSTSLLAEVGCASLEAVKVSTTPILSKILYGKTDVDFQVLVSVEAAAGLEEETGVAPVDLVVVLDVVTGARMGEVKSAMEFIIRKLDEGDRLAIVDREGSSAPHLMHMCSDGRGTWREKVDRLKAGGGAGFFVAGLQKAVQILNAREAGRQRRVGFILLLTDSDSREESETGTAGMAHYYTGRYPVHILGLGASHDAMALLRVARESQGSYSFVEEEKKIAPTVAVCLGGLKTVAAAGVRIWLDTSGSDERGVRIHRIDSGHHKQKISDTTGSVEVGVLYAGEVKNFLVHLRLPASLSSCCGGGTAPLLRVSYDYTVAPDIPAAAGATKGRGLVVQMPELVKDQADWQQDHPSHLVLHHIVQFRLNAMVDGFLKDFAASAHAHAHAMGLGDELQNQWDHFRRELQMWSRVDTRGMEPHVGAMVSSLRKSRSAGLAHVCSWVSTFQMQRPTSMGSTDLLATEFLTPAMKLMLEEAHRLPATANAIPPLLPGGSAGCLDFQNIDHRLHLWSKFRSELPPVMFFDGEQEQDQPTAAVFRDASLQAIDRAMHHDIYLAVVHASKQRRCVSGLE